MKLTPFEFYDEAEAHDRVRLHFRDGAHVEGIISGAMLGSGENPSVNVILSNGDRMRLRSGDSAEIIARGARRSREGF